MYCKIKGGLPLNGEVNVYGAKNEVLKILVASCITTGDIVIHNIPLIDDVYEKVSLLSSMNVNIEYVGERSLSINSKNMVPECPLKTTRIRTSLNLLGLLLGRFGKCSIPLPHGDKIGSRNFDIHFDALQKMGANISIEDGMINASVPNKRLYAIEYTLRFQSVGATENLIIAAVFANGKTVINNAAMEPEVRNLCLFIEKLGVKIDGIGSSRLVIHGSQEENKSSIEYTVKSDRIQIMTYMLLPLLTPNTEIAINYKGQTGFGEFLNSALLCGLNVNIGPTQMICSRSTQIFNGFNNYISTGVFPLFHTDILPPFVAALCLNTPYAIVRDTMYEGRFSGYVNELKKLKADINILNPNEIEIKRISGFQPTSERLFMNDIRSGSTLLLASLNCDGETTLANLQQCQRGYDNIFHNLMNLGANIKICYENSV